jgi:hypothetical protein
MENNGNKKYDGDKANVMSGVFLRFPRAIAEVARVSDMGCAKYSAPPGDKGYLDVEDGYRRYTEALGRHLIAETLEGPINTEKGGALPEEGVAVFHAAQVAWCALARLERYLRDLALPPPQMAFKTLTGSMGPIKYNTAARECTLGTPGAVNYMMGEGSAPVNPGILTKTEKSTPVESDQY